MKNSPDIHENYEKVFNKFNELMAKLIENPFFWYDDKLVKKYREEL